MKLRYIVLGILGIVIAFAVSLMIYLGVFRPVEFSEGRKGPFHLIYKDHVGAYHKIVKNIQDVETWAKQNSIDCKQSFGMYMDHPEQVEEARLRSLGGCVVTALPEASLPPDFKSLLIPERQYVVATFEGSPAIGPMKVYPKAEKIMTEKNYKLIDGVMEIYLIKSEKEMTTTYLFPVGP